MVRDIVRDDPFDGAVNALQSDQTGSPREVEQESQVIGLADDLV
jgi:hypothetical protein